MNLHSIVSGAIGTVNPHIPAQILASTGYGTNADGTRGPTYAAPVDVMIQRQELTQADLKQVDNLNLQGVLAAIYVDGNWYGVNRPDGQGGDLIRFGGQEWLVVAVREMWPDWTKVIACLQR